MRKILIILMFICGLGLFSDTDKSTIGEIRFYGTEWPNNQYKGGILFSLDKMPVGIKFFTITREDLGIKHFVSALMLAYTNNLEIQVSYDPKKIDGNKYCPIGQIIFPKK